MRSLRASLLCASFVGALLAGHAGSAGATDFTVCKDPAANCKFLTIQEGINAAAQSGGGTVSVGSPNRTTPETYNENIVMKDGVHLVSEGNEFTEDYVDELGGVTTYSTYDDQYNEVINDNIISVKKRTIRTIIHGSGAEPVVTFPSVTGTVLDGFIIENVDDNATDLTFLVKVVDSSPTIQNNIIRDNQGPLPLHNGGISIIGGATPAEPLIQDNVIHYVNGPGIANRGGSHPEIIHNEIFTSPSLRTLEGQGGAPGISFRDDAAATILNNHIFRSFGGGISSRVYRVKNCGFPFVIKGNRIHHNSTLTADAAGIYINGEKGAGVADEIDIFIGGPGLEGNDIYKNRVGIRLDIAGTNQYSMRDAVIENNHVHNNGLAAGFHLSNLRSLEVKNNIVLLNRVGFHVDHIPTMIYESNAIKFNGRGGIALFPSLNFPQDITVNNNDIYKNGRGGIRVYNADSTGVISNNRIYENTLGGIMFERSGSNFQIVDNDIHNNGRGGIHTGNDRGASTTFTGALGGLVLDIHGNKVHHNGSASYGGGIDVRHASGTITNNLVYKNNRAGIRFGDYITEINQNTVVKNGRYAFSDDYDNSGFAGGGIIYKSASSGLVGPPSGWLDVPIPIRNNIISGNYNAGIMVGCKNVYDSQDIDALNAISASWYETRNFNLLSANNHGVTKWEDPWVSTIVEGVWVNVWPIGMAMMLGQCNQHHTQANPNYSWECAINDIPKELCDVSIIPFEELFSEPMFVDAGEDDYHLLPESPAVDAGDQDPLFGEDVLGVGQGTTLVDIGAYGGPEGINW